ncbi:hypothetical protein BKA69DRAFT_1088236 [Paraphysoderma sedebokerense]|nr:hypothetical protein BKA69DRAFT_1088236 [Paraphysoderma sedebokerense]
MEKNWVEEFDEEFIKNHTQEFDGADMAFKNADDTADWIRQYEQSMAEFSESLKNVQSDDPEWQSLQNDWDRHAESSAFRADNPLYDHYEFEPDNPYLTMGTPHLELSAHNRTLPEEILALEAAVQTDPSNASAWYQLGTRQQENERESQAIAALRKAVELDPKVLDAWLALAVSYTNENCEQDSLDALESWISHHQRYKVILEEGRVRNGGGSRFDYVSSLFLEAARSNPGEDLDADVQVGLGVLFNLSEEYEKAVDCFEAALAKRPDDYLLWNKLGATLANSHSTSRAIDAYFHALQINPSFIRARYNLAISCINMGQHREAAEHLLVALTLQIGGDEWEVEWNDDGKGKGPAGSRKVRVTSGFMSSNVWDTLKMACLLMNRGDLVKFCDERNVDGFRNEFEF